FMILAGALPAMSNPACAMACGLGGRKPREDSDQGKTAGRTGVNAFAPRFSCISYALASRDKSAHCHYTLFLHSGKLEVHLVAVRVLAARARTTPLVLDPVEILRGDVAGHVDAVEAGGLELLHSRARVAHRALHAVDVLVEQRVGPDRHADLLVVAA